MLAELPAWGVPLTALCPLQQILEALEPPPNVYLGSCPVALTASLYTRQETSVCPFRLECFSWLFLMEQATDPHFPAWSEKKHHIPLASFVSVRVFLFDLSCLGTHEVGASFHH